MDTPETTTEFVPYMPWHFAKHERTDLNADGYGGSLSRVLASRKVGSPEASLRTGALRKATIIMKAELEARQVAEKLDEMDGNLVAADALREALAEERTKRVEAERTNLDLRATIDALRKDVARLTAANAMAVSS